MRRLVLLGGKAENKCKDPPSHPTLQLDPNCFWRARGFLELEAELLFLTFNSFSPPVRNSTSGLGRQKALQDEELC